MKGRLLSTLVASMLFATAVAWAAGVFDPPATAPEGAIGSADITITVGESGDSSSRIVNEVMSLTGPGIAVLATFALLLIAVGSVVAAQRNRGRRHRDGYVTTNG